MFQFPSPPPGTPDLGPPTPIEQLLSVFLVLLLLLALFLYILPAKWRDAVVRIAFHLPSPDEEPRSEDKT